MAVGGDISSLDIKDLNSVLTELEQGQFSEVKWEDFGLKAGLYKSTLENIKADHKENTHQCFVECLSCWLRKKDNVDSKGKPSSRRLVEILEELGERAVADKIRDRKGVPSDVHKKQQVEPVTTSGHSIYLAKPLEKQFLQLLAEFVNILTHFVKWVFEEKERLKDVKTWLSGIAHNDKEKKEIDEACDEKGLMRLLQSYCSLGQLSLVISLAEHMKMSDIVKELKQFEEKQEKLYEEILAKDFARSAIEYCGTTGSRKVTFEVLWPILETTLDDFEKFLKDVFGSQGISIHLSTAHNSRLTFVCIIPHWLVDEMKDYVMKNEDLFISKGVVEITVDETIVFSVKHSLEPHQLSLGIGDLDNVKTELDDFNKLDWKKIGSKAGLSYNTLDEIKENKSEVEDRFEECLACWLRRKDNVDSKGKPSWRRLAEILEELGERALADKIRERKGLTLSSDVHEGQQVGSVTTPGRSIFLPYHLKKVYITMEIEFRNILVNFAKEVFRMKMLNELKLKMSYRWRLSKKEMDDLKDERDLTILLRSHCSLWQFDVLKSLAEDMNMTGITDKLNQFEEKRKKKYSDIIAEDFAKSAIEYCGTTGSREVTFEVTWPIDEITLGDFEDFLQDVFSSQDINLLIHLKTVHQ